MVFPTLNVQLNYEASTNYWNNQIHLTEIQKLLEEFEDDQMQFAIELETYEKERVQSDKGDKEEDET